MTNATRALFSALDRRDFHREDCDACSPCSCWEWDRRDHEFTRNALRTEQKTSADLRATVASLTEELKRIADGR